MDQTDLEAATQVENATNNASSNKPSAEVHSRPGSPIRRFEQSARDVQLYRFTQEIVEKVLRLVPRVVQQHLAGASNDYELPVLAAVDAPSVAGLQESSLEQISKHRDEPSSSYQNVCVNVNPSIHRRSSNVSPDDRYSGRHLSAAETWSSEVPQSYKHRVTQLAASDIQAENQDRKSRCRTWRSSEWAHLEDPWKHVRCGEGMLFIKEEQRKSLQLDLVNALFAGPSEEYFDRYMKRGLPAVSCWISEIGLRLAELEFRPKTRVQQSQILIECLWACHYSKTARICDVLVSCYRRGVLPQPDTMSPNAAPGRIWSHIKGVRLAIYLLNILETLDLPSVAASEDLDEAWAMQISRAQIAMRPKQNPMESHSSGGPFFNVSDFSLKYLQRVGHIEIHWTTYWDEHLRLYIKGSSTELKLFWFAPTLARFFELRYVSASLTIGR
ncbi:MAG: hypothetical protein Q9198_000296 [Flavoplaca austrocitrina]